MRLVIKEYLTQLREKDELDLLICDLLVQMGYVTENVPKTGNRQYGVDIHAHNSKETLLCVVKQGNIDRKIWSGDQNAVRQSIEEIKDVYIRLMDSSDKNRNIRIVVATNGVLDEAVKPNWNGFVDSNRTWEECKVKIEFWNIDILVDGIYHYLFNEYLFGQEMQSFLRKSLYFVEEPDYKNYYFEKIINEYCDNMEVRNNKKFKRRITSLYLAVQMISQYAANVQKYKIAIMVNEYLIIKYWKFLKKNNLFEKGMYIEWLLKFLDRYEKWNDKYFHTIKECCRSQDMFPRYNNIVEQKVMLYEVIGYLSTFSYFSFFNNKDKARDILNCIIILMNNHPEIFYSPYDKHIGILNMLYRILGMENRKDEIEILIEFHCNMLTNNYKINRKYPTSADTFQDAVDIEMGNRTEVYNTSVMWGVILEWIIILNQEKLYNELSDFLNNDLKDVTKCVWFLREYEEELFYDEYAMNFAGEGIAIGMENDYKECKAKLDFIFEQYVNEKFSFEEYSFEALELIVCRYYGYIPRPKLS